MSGLTCPGCGNDDPSRIAGIEYRGVYDGVAVWLCLSCGMEFDRWRAEA